jgi:hypothetical protein
MRLKRTSSCLWVLAVALAWAAVVRAEPAASAAAEALKAIRADADPQRVVRLATDKPAYQIKKDRVALNVTSSHEGFVYLLMVGNDGKSFDLLFPNRKDDRNHILAGETWQLPRPGWAIRAGGPPGRDHLLAMVSATPRDLSTLGMQAAGPFSLLAATPENVRGLKLVAATAAPDAPVQCKEGDTACGNAYGADLIVVKEVE